MTTHVGLTQINALGQGGQNLGAESQGLRTQLMNLVADMEKDADAIQGNSLAALQQAKNELFSRFGELTAWCSQNGIKLGEGQGQINTTDMTGEQEFTAAGGGLASLSRPING